MEKITEHRIKELVADAVYDGTIAGANMLVLKDGEEIFYDQQGMADIEQGRPIGRDTIFRLYSMTKPVTSVAAMILLERGQLDLAQPVSDFLPGFAHTTVEKDGEIVPCSVPVTVHHLLNMTSGLTYGDLNTISGKKTMGYLAECVRRLHTEEETGTVEFADYLGTLPLAFEPDSSWHYGLSADVLGAVIEKASGIRFGEFLKQNIFEPLRMDDTDFWVPPQKQERLARVYETLRGGKQRLYTGDNLIVANDMKRPPAYEAGGAGLASTIDDYARFAGMLLNGGELDGERILSPQTVRFLTGGSLTDVQQGAFRKWVGLEGHTYTHLLRRVVDPGQCTTLARADEYGWDGWLGCYMANFPHERMTLLLMMQKKDAGTITLTRKIRNVLLADMK